MSILQRVRRGFQWMMGLLIVLGLAGVFLVNWLNNQLLDTKELLDTLSNKLPDTLSNKLPDTLGVEGASGNLVLILTVAVIYILAVVLAYREMQVLTRGMLQESRSLADSGAHLQSEAPELKAAATQQASGATEQAAAVSEITATVEELSRTAHEIAHAAEEGLAAAEEGQGAVQESVEGMERIRGQMDEVARRILSLGAKSQRIGEINDIISDIAGKTHLLALNAAIESAAAGEFGVRFAVVAAQVKELADETREATGQVKSVIQEIQNAINASVMATEDTTKEVNQGAQLAIRAGKVIEEIVQRVQGISLSTQQQQSGSEQVVVTMRDIQEVARQSAEAGQQTAERAALLVGIAARIDDVVMRLSDDGKSGKSQSPRPRRG
ncbi:MAG: hypothetical protein HY321_22920 [Armatimonadetes bacterium]|nr:hypothetical protein [Armatimonadota bacterium]